MEDKWTYEEKIKFFEKQKLHILDATESVRRVLNNFEELQFNIDLTKYGPLTDVSYKEILNAFSCLSNSSGLIDKFIKQTEK
jgi:hypothetical protein